MKIKNFLSVLILTSSFTSMVSFCSLNKVMASKEMLFCNEENKKELSATQKSLDWLNILPTDEDGLKPYLDIEVDKFKEYISEFPNWNTDRKKAIEDYFNNCANSIRPLVDETVKVARNISRKAVIFAKLGILIALNDNHPTISSPQLPLELEKVKEYTKLKPEEIILLNFGGYNSLDEQESYLDKEISNYILKLPKAERARIVHDWIADNIAYNHRDAGHEFSKSIYRNHPEQVLENGYGVCRGFSRLTNLLMRIVKVPSVYLVSDCHAFNAIFIEDPTDIKDKWTLIDTTFAAKKSFRKQEPLALIYADREGYPKKYTKNLNAKDLFPKVFKEPGSFESLDEHNKNFIERFSESHAINGGLFEFMADDKQSRCEIYVQDDCVYDITKEAIVNGKLVLPDCILNRIKYFDITDEKVLNKIDTLYLPKNIYICKSEDESLNYKIIRTDS